MTSHNDTHTETDAHAIVAVILEETRQALLCGDFAQFAPHFCLPYTLETFEGREVVTTQDALERLFLNSVSYYKGIGVTDLVRQPLQSSFRDATTLTTVYETRLIHFDQLIQRQPYVVYTEIVLHQGRWCCTNGYYAIADSPAHGKVLLDTN